MKIPFPNISGILQRPQTSLRGFGWSERAVLVVAFILFCGYCFIELVDEVKEGSTQTVDEWLLIAFRRLDDPAVPIGPAWLREAGMDVTALGSPAVLILMIVAVAGLMRLHRQYGAMLLTILATSTGQIVMVVLKNFIERGRPTVVPHLREVTTPSFPSGHAMLSAIVYLTLGILLSRTVEGRAAKLYCLTWAILLTFIVGVSRIYLGVHYPTDVLAGWMAGTAWALVWWVAARLVFFEKPGADAIKMIAFPYKNPK